MDFNSLIFSLKIYFLVAFSFIMLFCSCWRREAVVLSKYSLSMFVSVFSFDLWKPHFWSFLCLCLSLGALKVILVYTHPCLVFIINLSLQKGSFLVQFKVVEVIPLHKGGCKADKEHWRPIPILPIEPYPYHFKDTRESDDGSNLLVEHHCGIISAKRAHGAGILRRLKHILMELTLRIIYFAIIYPYISYRCLVRSSNFYVNYKRMQILKK